MELSIRVALPHSPDHESFDFTVDEITADGFLGRLYALANYGDWWVEEAWLDDDEGTAVPQELIRPVGAHELVEFAQAINDLDPWIDADKVELILDHLAGVGNNLDHTIRALERLDEWTDLNYSTREEWAEERVGGEIPDEYWQYFDFDGYADDQEQGGDVTFLSGVWGGDLVVVDNHAEAQL